MKKLNVLIMLFMTLLLAFPAFTVEVKPMSFLGDVEDQIVTQLKTGITDGTTIQSFPDDIKTFNNINPKGSILINYMGGGGDDSQSQNKILQKQKLNWGITIITRGIRGNDGSRGAYELIDKCKELLVGFIADGCEKMQYRSDQLEDQSNGIWVYRVLFTNSVTYIEES